jgi:hypothetical protein
MKTMVERVTDVLDEEDLSEFGKSLSQMGYGKTFWDKKTKESVVLENDRDSEKQRQRKELKKRYPNAPLRWTGRRWVLGKKKPTNKEIDNTRKRIKEELEQLEEISVRTGSLTVFLAKVKQYANKVSSHVSKRRTLGSKLETAAGTDIQKIQGEIARLEAETDEYEREMIMYNSLISAASGLGNDRSYKLLKKLEKKKRI